MKLLLKMKMFPGTAIAATAASLLCGCVFLIPLNAVFAAKTEQGAQSSPATVTAGAAVYQRDCAICHGKTREGIPSVIPPLTGVANHMTDDQIVKMVHNGDTKMPPVTTVKKDELPALLAFLHTEPALAAAAPSKVLDAHHGIVLSPEAAAGEALF
ncbi:MAG: cytochrome c, partial [Acidobacteriota bacterium]|nr:cytochrome c [Acidobacteriota bacterium]